MPAEYEDHPLKGRDFQRYREYHVGGDFLCMYELDEEINLVTFIRCGTHSELF